MFCGLKHKRSIAITLDKVEIKLIALAYAAIVNTDNQKLWQQAQVAQTSGDWSLLIQHLQQLCGLKDASRSHVRTQVKSEPPTTTQLLDLAIEVLVNGDFQQRWDVAKLIPRCGQVAIASLIEIVADEAEDEELIWFAVRILGEFDQPEAITALIELLKTTDSEELQAAAATALGQIGISAIASLTELLTNEHTRLLAVRSLAYIRRSETIDPLLSVVNDPQVAVRATALEALSSFHDSRIPPVLLSALDDRAPLVRREAVLGLGFRRDLCKELDLVRRLLPKLYDFNIDVCRAAAIALGRLGGDSAATGLNQVLTSPHTPELLQIEIVRALGRIETNLALDYLDLYFQQSSAVVLLQEIATVLGRIESPQLKAKATAILSKFLQTSTTASIKGAIALSLGHLGEVQAIDTLIELLADRDQSVKLHAIAALKQLAPDAYAQLQQMATDAQLAPELQQGVAIALSEW